VSPFHQYETQQFQMNFCSAVFICTL